MKTIQIELRVDYNDKAKEEVILKAARMAAKHLLTQAMLICDKRKPLIRLETGDMFESNKEIELEDDIDG